MTSLNAIDKATARLARQASIALEDQLRITVGLHFRQGAVVRIARPRWMPDRLYRYLMRTIVLELVEPTVSVR